MNELHCIACWESNESSATAPSHKREIGTDQQASKQKCGASQIVRDVEFMNHQLFGGQFDTPFFYAEDINRVPVFFGDYFFFDFVPSPEDTPVYDL